MHQAGGQLLFAGHIALGIQGEQGSSGGSELQQAGDGSTGARLGGRLQVLAQQDEGDQHGRGLKEVGGAIEAGNVVAHDVVVQDGDHGVDVGGIGAEADQYIHVGPACACTTLLYGHGGWGGVSAGEGVLQGDMGGGGGGGGVAGGGGGWGGVLRADGDGTGGGRRCVAK